VNTPEIQTPPASFVHLKMIAAAAVILIVRRKRISLRHCRWNRRHEQQADEQVNPAEDILSPLTSQKRFFTLNARPTENIQNMSHAYRIVEKAPEIRQAD
jgi:hypothetical protein